MGGNMLKIYKLLFLTVIAVLLFGSVFPLYAYGETEDGIVVDDVTTGETDGNGLPYLVVLGYRGYKNNVNIPSVVEGQTVKYIAESAFSCNGNITDVIIPDTVTDIGDNVFGYCINLRTVVLPKTLTKINNTAFIGCTLLTSVTLPDTLTEIGDSAFENCAMLGTLKIPASVTKIGHYAFITCENLILNCTDNAYALSYAAENNIASDAVNSPDYPMWTTIKITIALGAAVIAVNFAVKLILRRRKKLARTK